MQVTIDAEIPDGYEATGEYRVPKKDEYHLTESSTACCATSEFYTPRIILRKKWVWPKWLKSRWIAKDASGLWFGYTEEPRLRTCRPGEWEGSSAMCLSCVHLVIGFPDVPWKDSLMKNPHL